MHWLFVEKRNKRIGQTKNSDKYLKKIFLRAKQGGKCLLQVFFSFPSLERFD
jgi:hypothetical protein